ncbi:hypothetical protein [Photobacterium sp. OFAV2-7]|uniref:hypothetical protein n=1 Tax=Photobacterium sp. OFAV2-7 TaxID=2917748 RepID=UPI001EF6A8BC|nr:hypothetical protein [Photobacterium sp. OFAV2-7]MCG7588445.1 hypothetical protein [Photobacterium sp. OFAV2-7]
MNQLSSWLAGIKSWYHPQQQSDIDILVNAVSHAPEEVFGLIESELHSEALAYWLDACTRLSYYYQDRQEIDKAFSYLQFAYAKLQDMACRPELDSDMKRWCLKKLDRMIVAIVEFCQRQCETKWQQESTQLIELHVMFMEGQNNLNLAYSDNYPAIK